MPTFTDWYTSRETRRVERFEKLTSYSPRWAGAWRTPGRTKALVVVYFAAVALGAASVVIGLWLPDLFLLYLVSLVVLAVCWTMLRATIGMRDSAPREVLDEYEARVLDFWRELAYRTFHNLNLLLALLVLAIPLFTDGSLTGTGALALGIALIYTVFIAGSLPAVGYALTFNMTDTDKE